MNNSVSTPIQNYTRKLTYLLSAVSILNCIIRNDYNVVFGFLILGIINKFYLDNPKYFSKILIHLVSGLIIVDVIWIIIVLPYWNSKSENHNDYWESLSFIHTFSIILAFIEILIKALIGYFLINDYKKQFKSIKDLFLFNYESNQNQNDILGK